MMSIRPRLSYANVVATLALFLAVSGGVVWAAGKISGKQIKANSIPGNRIKENTLTNNRIKKSTLTNDRIKPGTIQRTALAAGALSGLTVADASAANLPGAVTATPPGPTPVPLTGTTSFTPVAGKSYLLQGELIGNPVNKPGETCFVGVQVYVNGIPVTFVEVLSFDPSPGFDAKFPEGSGTTSLLTETGVQTITAKVFGNSNCTAATTLNTLRIKVSELG
jgi:hypothetical protein